MENEIKLFYDLTAERTADEWHKEDIMKPTIIDFCNLLPKKPRVLDLGCVHNVMLKDLSCIFLN